MPFQRGGYGFAFALLFTWAHVSAGPAPVLGPPIFENDASISTQEGHVALEWRSDDPSHTEFELQYSTDKAFSESKVVYEGRQTSSFISGLKDGQHFFRVRMRAEQGAPWGPWSTLTQVSVKHHSLWIAWSLFAVGGLMFVMIVLFVVIQSRRLQHVVADGEGGAADV